MYFDHPTNTDEVLQNAHETKEKMDDFLLENPPIKIPPDSIWVIDPKSGCYFRGYELIHTDKCQCDQEEDRMMDERL